MTEHAVTTAAFDAIRSGLWSQFPGATTNQIHRAADAVVRAEHDRLRTLIAPLRMAYEENGMEAGDVAWVDGFNTALDIVLPLLCESTQREEAS